MRLPSLAILALLTLCGCTSTETLGTKSMTFVGQGIVNDPKNRSLRFDLLKFGLESFCTEMKKEGVALKLSDEHPVMGRFFSKDCQSEVVDDEQRKSLMLRFTGQGYAWTNVTGRIGFDVVALVEYATDFQLADDRTLYVYFRPRNIQATTYQAKMVESAAAKGALALANVDPNRIGKQILSAQLERGFTVIRREARGETEYGLGVIELGTSPFKPFTVSSEKRTVVNDRTEIHSGQQDIISGIAITGSNQAVTITASIDGAAAVDLFVISELEGSRLLERYVAQPGPVQLSMPPSLDESVPYGTVWQRTVSLPEGNYGLLLDNTKYLGRAAPPDLPGDDRAVKVDYLVQVGKSP